MSARAFAAETAYDKVAAATRLQYSSNAAKCRAMKGEQRPGCLKLARTGAHAALDGTYSDAVAGAKAAYARTAARCKTLPGGERRRCLRTARAERAMALGKAEEIRSAPLAMGSSN